MIIIEQLAQTTLHYAQVFRPRCWLIEQLLKLGLEALPWKFANRIIEASSVANITL